MKKANRTVPHHHHIPHGVFCLLLLFGLPVATVYADDQAPVIYSRTVLRIVPKPEAPPAAAAQEKKEESSKPTEVLPHLPRVTKEFAVDVRQPAFLAQQDFIAHQPFTDKEGMLILIDPPERTVLKSANLLAKVDVLFVAADGLITKIAPGLSLAGLSEPIDSENPIHAFVFLKAGMAGSSDIKPGDHVMNALFKAHPVILQ